MTYREELMKEHPEWNESEIQQHVDGVCPNADNHLSCSFSPNGDYDCDKCWDREITPANHVEKIPDETTDKNNDNPCDTCIHSGVCKYKKGFVDYIERLKKIPNWIEVIVRCKHNL